MTLGFPADERGSFPPSAEITFHLIKHLSVIIFFTKYLNEDVNEYQGIWSH